MQTTALNNHSILRKVFLLFCVWASLTGVLSLSFLDENIVCLLSILLLFPFALIFRWEVNASLLTVCIVYFSLIKIYYFIFVDPVLIGGPDAIRYYEQIASFNTIKDFLNYAWNDFKLLGLDTSSYTLFGMLYMPFFKILGIKYSGFIITLNSLMLISSIYMWHRMNLNNLKFDIDNKPLFSNVLVFCLFFSAFFSYFSSLFLKDITSLFLGILLAYLIFKKKYVWSGLVLFYSFLLRPYSIVYTGCYYLIINKMYKTSIAISIFSVVVVFYRAGITGVVNTFSMFTYIFLTPNPLNLENWKSVSLPVIESLITLLFCIVMSIMFLTNKSTRGFYFICILNIYIYSCVLTLVGYENLLSKNIGYGLFTAGDEMFRKKLNILPIIYMMIAYSVSQIKFAKK